MMPEVLMPYTRIGVSKAMAVFGQPFLNLIKLLVRSMYRKQYSYVQLLDPRDILQGGELMIRDGRCIDGSSSSLA